MRDRRLQRIEAVIQRQQRVAPERDNRRLLGFGQGRGMRGLRPGLHILDCRPLAPLRDRLRVDPQLSAQRQQLHGVRAERRAERFHRHSRGAARKALREFVESAELSRDRVEGTIPSKQVRGCDIVADRIAAPIGRKPIIAVVDVPPELEGGPDEALRRASQLMRDIDGLRTDLAALDPDLSAIARLEAPGARANLDSVLNWGNPALFT